jgi:hypothetical protein
LFPGINALVITLATALVIFAAPSSCYSDKLLSSAVPKFFGKISYSLYLWHWPIIVFYQLGFNSKPTYAEQFLILLCSVLLGSLSWCFVERGENFKSFSFTLRAGKRGDNKLKTSGLAGNGFKGNRFNAMGISFVGSFFLIIIALIFLTGLPHRYSEQQLKYSAYINYDRKDYYRQGSCFLTSEFNDFDLFDIKHCVSFDSNKHNTLLIGDSHAAQWYSALAVSKKESETVTQVTASGCKPTFSYRGANRCTQLMRWAFEELVKENSFDRIIISARWFDSDLPSLIATVNALAKYSGDIKVFGNIIEYDLSLPRLLASKETLAEINQYRKFAQIKKRDQLFSDMLVKSPAQFISVFNVICSHTNVCKQTTLQNNPIQYDYGHLTYEGSVELITEIKSKYF